MELEKFEHINILLKLLGKIRYSDQLDSDDIDFYATSPLLVEIHDWLSKEWIQLAIDKGIVIKEAENQTFEFDSHVGQMLQKRIDSWDFQKKALFKKMLDTDIQEYATLMIKPLMFSNAELDKLTNYIKRKINV